MLERYALRSVEINVFFKMRLLFLHIDTATLRSTVPDDILTFS